jgi:hypothetical protein
MHAASSGTATCRKVMNSSDGSLFEKLLNCCQLIIIILIMMILMMMMMMIMIIIIIIIQVQGRHCD